MQPPKWSIAFLNWFCPKELKEGILGDLLEQFHEDQMSFGIKPARRKFVWNVFRLFHPYLLLRNHLTVKIIYMGMLKSHLIVAIRSMMKYKFYSFINLLGLSLAIAFIFLAYLFIQNELSYDQFHSKKASIYRVYHDIINTETNQSEGKSAVTAIPLGRDLADQLPGIVEFSRYASGTFTVKKEEIPYREVVHFVDPGFLKMFDFPMLKGDPNTALDLPTSVIISEDMSDKYFGHDNPLGKSLNLSINDTILLLNVSGVIDPQKNRSSIPFDFLVHLEQFQSAVSELAFNSYNFGILENYIQIDQKTTKEAIEPLLTKAIENKSNSRQTNKVEYGLQALSTLHMEDQIIGNALYTSPQKLYIMLAISILVLIIAGINFITLSTSHVLNRLKEVGVRKTLGARRGQLKRQFVMESFLVTIFSGLIGIAFARLMLPTFSEIINSEIGFNPGVKGMGLMVLLTLIIAWLNGWLQSMVLVRFNTTEALKGNMVLPRRNRWFNEGLVVIQFALSIILIIGAVNIRAQMQYLQHKDLGYDKERLLEITMGGVNDLNEAQQLVDRFHTLATQDSRILEISASMNNSSDPWTSLVFDQDDGSKETLFYNQINDNYLQTMEIELLEGSDFRVDAQNLSNAILVNESLVKHFGWESPFEQQIPGSNFTGSHQIIGVVKDFHFNSLHEQIKPLILTQNFDAIGSGVTGLSTHVWPANLYNIVVRIGPGEIQPILDHLESTWKKINPGESFTFNFVDEVLDAKYAEEKRWGKTTDWASIFAIIIAWLGLVGMMRLTIQKRTKEVGIRKVLGASTGGVIQLLSRRFLLLVLLGSLIAWPVSWILMKNWLESFSYRIDLNPLLFLMIGIAVLLAVLASISLQSLRLASSNPIKALRFE